MPLTFLASARLACSIANHTPALQYLTITRPDISFAVNHACQFMHASTVTNFTVIKRLLRYVQGTLHHDSNWAGNVLDRKSTTGFCVFLGPNLVSSLARKQPTIYFPIFYRS
ncbi:hypothetical protein CsSME_00003233 [Camellia sinensis var. sinensis]